MLESLSRHLDLGCGGNPRNPYKQKEVFGVDISAQSSITEVKIRSANLSVEPIPFPDSYFSSVSAYDFLEHVPRILGTHDGRGTRFPFVELMNEIWRVLIPGGLFYAQTPAYPSSDAFQDPTHVNIITDASHIYFTRPTFSGRMYGFIGDFEIVRVMRIPIGSGFDYEPLNPDLRRRFKIWMSGRKGGLTHLIWEFRAIKS
jgi:SAM-dependent methyltransferase